MTENEHSGERVLLYILVGIGIFALGYLFWKDQFKRQDSIQTQSIGSLGSLGYLGRTTSQLALSNPRIDELERQTIELETQTNAFNEKLKSYDYQISQLSNKNNRSESIPKMYQLSGSGQPSRAGSVTSIRTTVEDKTRQQSFGMI